MILKGGWEFCYSGYAFELEEYENMCIEEQNNFAMVLLPVTNQATTLLTLRITAQLIMYYLGRTMFHGGPFIKY